MEYWKEQMLDGMEMIREACASVDDTRCKDCPFKKACDKLGFDAWVGVLLAEYNEKTNP